MPIKRMAVWQKPPQNVYWGPRGGALPCPVDVHTDVEVVTGEDARLITGKATPVLRIPGDPPLLLDRAFLLEILRIMERETL